MDDALGFSLWESLRQCSLEQSPYEKCTYRIGAGMELIGGRIEIRPDAYWRGVAIPKRAIIAI